MPKKDANEKNTVSKNTSRQSTQSSSLSHPAQTKALENEILERGKEQVRINSNIKNIESDNGAMMNHLGGKQNVYEHNVGGKPSNIINSAIQSSETEPLVKSPTGNGAATHPV